MVPLGLLARAALRRVTDPAGSGDLPGARVDLDEAEEIAERGGMRLHLCDVYLEGTRQHLASGDVGAARRRLGEAKGLVEACGYGRRTAEVVALEAEVASAAGGVLAGEQRPEERQEDERQGKERQEETSPARPVGASALRTWRKKLDYLLAQEALLTDPARKFEVAEQIEEARRKIAELEELTAGA